MILMSSSAAPRHHRSHQRSLSTTLPTTTCRLPPGRSAERQSPVTSLATTRSPPFHRRSAERLPPDPPRRCTSDCIARSSSLHQRLYCLPRGASRVATPGQAQLHSNLALIPIVGFSQGSNTRSRCSSTGRIRATRLDV